MQSSILILILGLLAIICNALPTKRAPTTEYSIQLVSDTEFCSFVPPKAGDDVGGTENDGIPNCTNTTLGGALFPSGFIKTAHYVKESSYVQVTGTINRSAYNLNANDGGGQYDNRDIDGVTCNGYKYFVNLIEPDSQTFCIRCCEEQSDCRLGISTQGCETIVPGSYN
ncbi:unnamed protein product [Mucor hiemalis]